MIWKPDPRLDLALERIAGVPRELVWAAWTQPGHVRKWFTPAATWRCYLEVVPNERLVWTDALLPGYRPSENPFFTAILTLEAHGAGTRYIATALHRDQAGRQRHEAMGFREGWGKALDQLVAHAKTM